MPPRIEAGRVVEVDGPEGVLELESGKRVRFALEWVSRGPLYDEDERVLATLDGKRVVSVELDLRAIGMTEREAMELANVQARLDELVAKQPLSAAQREAFEAVVEMAHGRNLQRARRLVLERALAGGTLPLSDEDPWAARASTDLPKIENTEAWIELLTLAGGTSKPTKKWLTEARALVKRIGVAAFVETVRSWWALVTPRPVVRDAENWFTPAMNEANADALKNLVWACATIDEPRASEVVAVAVGDLAVRCFTKIRGVGALSSKAGNACIYVLSQLPGMRAVAQLSRLGSRVRYKVALSLIEKAKLECATRAGVSPIDLEELSLPTFGLDVEGRARIEIGDHTAELAIVDDKAALAFFDGKKRLKAVPESIKSDHAEDLAELKASQKELAALLPTVRARLERWMVEPRSWTLADLRTRYLDHPLVARLARRLIFATEQRAVIFFDGFPIDVDGKQVELTDDASLSLWHPLERPERERAAWRRLLESLDVTQPFKQVDRELYAVDDAERTQTETRQFAGRAMRQHQLAALCRERGWTYSLMGTFDGGNAPTKHIAAYDLTVTFDVDVPDDARVADSGIYLDVTSGAVRFVRASRPMALAKVPPRCFSEVMRDVDLFTAV
jgi:hypothetical protein